MIKKQYLAKKNSKWIRPDDELLKRVTALHSEFPSVHAIPAWCSKLANVKVKSLSFIDKRARRRVRTVHPLHTVFLSYRRVHSLGGNGIAPRFYFQ